jgi:putative endonuclease
VIRRRGQSAEKAAERWLVEQGLEPVARNLHLAGGELDLVMQDGETLVFVEVRHRSRNEFGDGVESVGPTKRRHLTRAATAFLAGQPVERDGRFDVLAINGPLEQENITWIQDAFEPEQN